MRGLGRSSLLRDALAMGLGTAGGQGVTLLFAPLITRIYGPEAFGFQGLFLSLISLLGPVVALRYPMAIVVAGAEAEARLLGRLSLALALAAAGGLALGLAMPGAASFLPGAPALGALIWFLPLALWSVTFSEVAEFQAVRRGAFGLIGRVTLVQALLFNLARLAGGLMFPFAFVLVALSTVAPMVQGGQILWRLRRRDGQVGRPGAAERRPEETEPREIDPAEAEGFSCEPAASGKAAGSGKAQAYGLGRQSEVLRGGMRVGGFEALVRRRLGEGLADWARLWGAKAGRAWRLALRYRDFPLYRMPNDLLNAAAQAAPVLLLAGLFSPVSAGFYVLARSVLSLPGHMIGAALGTVLFERYAKRARAGQSLLPLVLWASGGLLLLWPLILGLAMAAPPIFAFVFGEDWREAGVYARWMALWTGAALANIPAVRLAPVIGAQAVMLGHSLIWLVLRVGAMLAVYGQGGGAQAAVAAFSLASLAGTVVLVLLLVLRARRFEARRGARG